MNPTIKLYYDNAYTDKFKASVLLLEKRGDGSYGVVLDRTAFFPESGGQGADHGSIAGGEVFDVHIKDEVITHYVRFENDPTGLLGSEVPCSVDFDRRYDFMQQHSGEHIFSGVVMEHFGYENVGFHLSENIVTMDYNGKLSPEELIRIEDMANEAIRANHKVNAYFPDPEELSKLDYRSKLEASEMGEVRIVSIDSVDICACCAPHVKSTGEVGLLKILDCANYKSGVRITIVCGERALRDYRQKHERLLDLTHLLSVPIEGINEAVEKLKASKEELEAGIKSLEEASLKSLEAGCDTALPVLFCKISDTNLVRASVNRLLEGAEAYALAFNGDDEHGYSFILASKKDDATDMLHRLSESLDIKGGGSRKMVQGKTPASQASIREAVKLLS